MSLPCPYRHVSYAAWRLGVIRTLCQSFGDPHLRSSAPLRREYTKPHLRDDSDPRSVAENGDKPSAQIPPTPATPSTRVSDRRDSGQGGSFSPYTGPGHQAIKQLISDLKKASKKIQLGNEDVDSYPFGTHKSLSFDTSGGASAQDSSRQHPLADVPLRKYVSTQGESLDAYNAEGNQAVKGLLTELQEVRKKIQPSNETDDNPRLPEGENCPIPESPIIARVENAARRREERKVHPSYRRIKGLKNNPWAETLASPLRACQGSGARLPSDLLLDFGYIKNQKDGKIYLMPANLADVDALETKLAAELAISEGRSRTLDDGTEVRGDNQIAAEDGMTKNNAEPDGFLISSSEAAQNATKYLTTSRRYVPAQSRLLSNLTFLRLLTNKVTQPANKNSKSPSLTRVETIPGEVGKLIHFDTRESVSTAQHYLQNKYRFDSAVRGQNAAGKPTVGSGSPSADQIKGRFNLNRLQWQPDVHLRIADIFRKRIFVSMKALADSESAARSHTLPERPSGVVSLPIPQAGVFNGEELRRLMRVTSSTTTSAGIRIRAVASETKEKPSPSGVSSSTSTTDHSTQTPSPPAVTAQNPEYYALGHSEWLPGSIFLHVGSDDIAFSHPSSDYSSSTLPPLPSGNPLIPPMITVLDTYRFPVFSLHQLFANVSVPGTSDMGELNSLISQQSIFQHPDGMSGSGEDNKGDYLLLIRPVPGPAKAAVEEIWRLWRYLGGRNMDLSFASETKRGSSEDKKGNYKENDVTEDDEKGEDMMPGAKPRARARTI